LTYIITSIAARPTRLAAIMY